MAGQEPRLLRAAGLGPVAGRLGVAVGRRGRGRHLGAGFGGRSGDAGPDRRLGRSRRAVLGQAARAPDLVAGGLVDQTGDLGTVDGLVVEQGAGHRVEARAVAAQDLTGPVLLFAQDALDLLVDDPGCLVAVVTVVHEVLAQENHALRAPRHGPDPIA